MTRRDDARRGPFRRLTGRQEKFCREFYLCQVATRAALLAGYAPGSARQVGHALLKRPHVRRAIEELRKAEQPEAPAPTLDLALQRLGEAANDPSAKLRVDASKVLLSHFSRKEDPASQECSRCRYLEPLKALSADDLHLRIFGLTRDRAKALSATEFDLWTKKVLEEGEAAIRLAASIRSGTGVPSEPIPEPAQPVFAPFEELLDDE